MQESPAATITVYFADLEEPRRYNRWHPLHEIIVIAICAAIAGADDWVEVEVFGRAKEAWFREFLELPHGIPSHDTFGRVFAALNPEQFQKCFVQWTQAASEKSKGELYLSMARSCAARTIRHWARTQSIWSVLGLPRTAWSWGRSRLTTNRTRSQPFLNC
jgi:hypothetical protein